MHYNSKRNDNPYCSQSICFLKIFSGNCFAFFDSYPSFVSYQKLTVMKTSDPIAKPVQRDWYLVNLKVFLILLVIFHHAGPAYSDSDNWIYQPSLDECAV